MYVEVYIGNTLLRIIQGDITEQDTEAIVNAANSGLLGGGGVDGAIHAVGGPQILKECRAIRARHGKLPAGQAVITGGGLLKSNYVIHTVGPVWFWGLNGEDEKLRSAYYNSLLLASKSGISSIAFPSISTGAYRYPVMRAARIAILTVAEFIRGNPCFKEVRFVLFNESAVKAFETALIEINA